jgi:hypothetical protein
LNCLNRYRYKILANSKQQAASADQPSTTPAQNAAQSSASTNQNDAPAAQTKKDDKLTPPDIAHKKIDPDAGKNTPPAQPKPDQTTGKTDTKTPSPKPNQQSSQQSQQTGSNPNWLLGLGTVGGGAGLAGLFTWHKARKREAQKQKVLQVRASAPKLATNRNLWR